MKPEEAEQFLLYINSAAQNTLTLLDNLLAWARSQSGNSVFSPERMPLQDVMSEILDVAASAAAMKNITIHYASTDDIDVYADANMLKTILRNLISNAMKYTHHDGQISVSSVRNNGSVEITVADNGVGMTDEVLQKLFKVDKSVTTRGTADEKGSGLGLILCKDFVEKHRGTIWVESTPGNGSAFSFSLPMN